MTMPEFVQNAPAILALAETLPFENRDNTIIMNAQRPLYGEYAYGDRWLRGRYYARLDLNNEAAEKQFKQNINLEGITLIPVEDKVTLLKACWEQLPENKKLAYKELAQETPQEVADWLIGRYSSIKHSYRECMELLALAKNSDMPANLEQYI